MTIDIITALDQAFFQAETAENDEVRKRAIQHFINVAGIMEQQLRVAGIIEVRLDGGGGVVRACPSSSYVVGCARACPSSSYVVGGMCGGAGGQSLPGGGAGGQSLPGGGAGGAASGGGGAVAGNSTTPARGGAGKALSGILSQPGLQAEYWTPERVAAFNSLKPVQKHDNDKATLAPDVINMTNPANWLPGDTLLRKTVHGNFPHFTSGKQYTVTSNGPDVLTIMGNNGVEVTYPHKPFCEPASNFFTWLRHGEA